MFFIKVIAKSLAALNSNGKPTSIAIAVSMAFLLAVIPTGNLLWIAFLLISILLRAHLGIELLFILIFKGFSHFLTVWTEPFGWMLMEIPSVQSIIYTVYNIPLLFLSDLNNSIMVGGLSIGIIMWGPLFILTMVLVKLFREKIAPGIARSKAVKAIEKMPLFNLFIRAFRQFSGLYR